MAKPHFAAATRKPVTSLVACAIAMSLAGCDGDSGQPTTHHEQGNEQQASSSSHTVTVSQPATSSSSSSPAVTTAIDYNKLQKTQPSGSKLTLADAETLEQHIKNGLRLYLSSQYRSYNDCWYSSSQSTSSQITSPQINSSEGSWSSCDYYFDFGSSTASFSSFQLVSSQAAFSSQAVDSANSSSAPSISDNEGGFSETNTHVAGVDEIDFAKYDGNHWYIASTRTSTASPQLKVYEADANAASLTLAGALPIEMNAAEGFYLLQDQEQTEAVAFLHSDGGYYDYLPGSGYWGSAHYQNGSISIDLADVTSPQNPQMAWQIAIDGSVIESRKVGNTLYIVSRYEPWLDGTEFDYQDSSIRAQNEAAIEAASLEDLLPKVRINQQATVLAPSCYLQASLSENDGYRSLVYVTSIDLAERKVADSVCINSAVDGLSMTQDSLYLTNTWYPSGAQTAIHKFEVDNTNLQYVATGNVTGSIQGRSDPAFRLHEHEGDLRIVTSQGRNHQLFILEQFGDALELVAQLPNTARPEAIGKPGEDIYAVRFDGNAAYIVTFRQTDPLYKIDLTDRLDPKIAGELEVTGFSTYLHPLDDGYAFGIGREANELGRITGMKVALYDVSGDDPVEVQSHVYDGWQVESAALNDLHAVTVSADKTRFVIPVTKGRYYSEDGATGFLLFELASGEQASLQAAGALITHRFDGSRTYHGNRARSVLHNDAVFMTQDGEVWANTWQALTSESGRVDHQFFRCAQADSLTLNISVSAQNNYACNTDVDFINELTGESFDILGAAQGHELCTFQVPINSGGEFTVTAKLDGFEAQTHSLSIPEYFCASDIEPIAITF